MTTLDHRTRTAALKRERMRLRLIESALLVFARKGIDAAVIEDVIELADVSRGTFYNYFKTNEDVMAAVLHELGNELLVLVDAVVTQREDPVERLACGVRMVLHTTRRYPEFAKFASRVGVDSIARNSPALLYLPRDLQGGIDEGRFALSNLMVGLDLVVGTTWAAIDAMANRPGMPADYPEEITYHVLLGLGVTKASARRLVNLPIQSVELPPDSLLSRTQNKHVESD